MYGVKFTVDNPNSSRINSEKEILAEGSCVVFGDPAKAQDYKNRVQNRVHNLRDYNYSSIAVYSGDQQGVAVLRMDNTADIAVFNKALDELAADLIHALGKPKAELRAEREIGYNPLLNIYYSDFTVPGSLEGIKCKTMDLTEKALADVTPF